MANIYRPRDTISTTTPPAYGGSGVAGDTYALENPDCNLSTKLRADDVNFIIDNLRIAVRGMGVSDADPEDATMLLQAFQAINFIMTGPGVLGRTDDILDQAPLVLPFGDYQALRDQTPTDLEKVLQIEAFQDLIRLVGATQTGFGFQAGSAAGLVGETAFGYRAASGNTGTSVTAIGNNAGQGNTGAAGVFVGSATGSNNTANNVNALGNSSANLNTGSNIVAIGNSTLIANESPFATAVGIRAAGAASPQEGVAIGYVAGVNDRGVGNTYVGAGAGIMPSATPKSVTAVNTALNQLTVPAHGYGAVGDRVSLFTSGTVLPTGLIESWQNFIVVNANTLEALTANITTNGSADVTVAEPSQQVNDAIGIGRNATPTKDHQAMIGDAALEEVFSAGAFVTLQYFLPGRATTGGLPTLTAAEDGAIMFNTTTREHVWWDGVALSWNPL